ncbi:MAG TPA: glycosyltransferase family 39 protein, partial [Thermoanaerobaculia bacterium]|nr:glycosyltransferase family 39 protein [Thermoanaerobaculia bacterium]
MREQDAAADGGAGLGAGSPAADGVVRPAAAAPRWPVLAIEVWGLSVVALALQLATLCRYGWFRDELYYAACGRRLAFGYVDHPPMVALLAWLSRVLLGESLPAQRLLPALAGAAVVLLAGLLARELGGGRRAQLLAAVCTLVAPRYLAAFHGLSTNTLEILVWTVAALAVARLAAGAEPRHWLVFGAVAGVCLETKHSMLFFGLGLAVGLLLTPFGRRALRERWVYLGAAVAAALWLPNLLWEVAHGWPTLEFLRNAQAWKNLPLSPAGFLADQVLAMQPLTLPVWAAGCGWLLVGRGARRFRVLGWTALTVAALLVAWKAKGYYLGPIFPLLFAAGATAIEGAVGARAPAVATRTGGATPVGAAAIEGGGGLAGAAVTARSGRAGRRQPDGEGRSRRGGWAVVAIAVLLLLGGAVTAPFGLPLLPPAAFVRYQAALGVKPGTTERQQLGELPQHYADMFGWPEMTAEVARVYRALPPPQQSRACVFGRNYGEAGAIEQLGRRLCLPPAISGHNSYFLWGPGRCDGSVLILLGGSPAGHRAMCAELREAGRVRSRYAMPYEN